MTGTIETGGVTSFGMDSTTGMPLTHYLVQTAKIFEQQPVLILCVKTFLICFW